MWVRLKIPRQNSPSGLGLIGMARSNLLSVGSSPREGAIKKTDGGALLFSLLPPSPLSSPPLTLPLFPPQPMSVCGGVLWGG